MPSIAVVIISYNTKEHLRACLKTVLPENPCEVIVVDNASVDGSADMVRAEFPQVTLYANNKNLGYGAAANQAIFQSMAEYILLLNSDLLLQPGTLEALSDYLDAHPRVAVVGPRLLNADGTLQASCFPFPGTLQWLYDNDVAGRLLGRVPVLKGRSLRTWSHDSQRVVPWVKGAAMEIRRRAFVEVNGFDESYFMYYEETDLCYLLNKAGWEIHFAPVTAIIHIGAASTMHLRTEMTVQQFSSAMHFHEKHYSGLQVAALRLIWKCIVLIRFLRGKFRLHFTRGTCNHANIENDVAVWQRILFGDWRGHAACDQARISDAESLTGKQAKADE